LSPSDLGLADLLSSALSLPAEPAGSTGGGTAPLADLTVAPPELAELGVADGVCFAWPTGSLARDGSAAGCSRWLRSGLEDSARVGSGLATSALDRSDRAESDRADSERADSERVASERVASGRDVSDRADSERVASERAESGRVASDRGGSGLGDSDRADSDLDGSGFDSSVRLDDWDQLLLGRKASGREASTASVRADSGRELGRNTSGREESDCGDPGRAC
jgi:hypothetical protein